MMCVLCIILHGGHVEMRVYFFTYSLLLLNGGGALSAGLLLALSLLEESLRDHDLVVGRDGTIRHNSDQYVVQHTRARYE